MGSGKTEHERLNMKDGILRGRLTNGMLEAVAKSEAIDPNDPPVFESQAAYLERYKLLSDGGREALPTDAFEPVRYVPV